MRLKDLQHTISVEKVHDVIAHCISRIVVHFLSPALELIPNCNRNVLDFVPELVDKLIQSGVDVVGPLKREAGRDSALDITRLTSD